MNLTQNIDSLELKAGLPANKFVQAHGSVNGAQCAKCRKDMDSEKLKSSLKNGEVYLCDEQGCKGPVKPQIIFFEESLPKKFFD